MLIVAGSEMHKMLCCSEMQFPELYTSTTKARESPGSTAAPHGHRPRSPSPTAPTQAKTLAVPRNDADRHRPRLVLAPKRVRCCETMQLSR
jgi:hypothetical protein